LVKVPYGVKYSSGSVLAHQLALAALETLSQVPFVQADRGPEPARSYGLPGYAPDAAIEVVVGAERYELILAVQAKGEPRMARDAAAKLLHYLAGRPRVVGVFAAPYISPQAARICRESGIGYVDLAGNCHLAFGSVYVHVDGKPNVAADRRPLRSLYAPKSERVLRVLLRDPARRWQVQSLAAAAHVSIGLVSKVKSCLSDREWVESGPAAGVRLTTPGELLDDWARVYAARKTRHHEFFSLRGLPEIEAGVAEVCSARDIPYALTGLSAAARLAPFVRYQRADAYVAGPLDPILHALDLKVVPSGSNVRIRTPYDAGVLFDLGEHDGIALASSLQIYLDLRAEGGRAEDGAEFLRERILEPMWRGDR